MASRFHSEFLNRKSDKGGGAMTGHKGKKPGIAPFKTASWPGAGGKTQPRDRSAGVSKVKTHAKKEGL